MEEKKKKVVVAFSGGLDTSFTVMYRLRKKGMKCMLLVQTRVVSVKSS